MNRIVAYVLAALVAAGVLAAIGVSVLQKQASGTHPAAHLTVVRGVIGPEKQPFFQDAQVRQVFRDNGLDVQVDTAGSRQIATTVNLAGYDFAFPAGVPAAHKIQQDHHVSTVYQPFYSPMAIATFKPIVQMLMSADVVTQQNGAYFLDVKKYLALVAQNKRWTDLADHAAYPAAKSILISSTDVRTSNSAAMYLAIASYVANGDNVVQDTTQATAALPQMEPLFLRQGYTESSSEGPFDNYLSIGIGDTPMVMIYEAQFLADAVAHNPAITSQMVLMYPNPTVLSKHTLVPLDANGSKVGRLLTTNPALLKLAVKYGFRTSDPAYFKQYLSDHGYPQPPDLINQVDAPTYEVLEFMIEDIEKKLGG